MHIILGIIGLATAAYFMVMRARRGAEMATELLDVADDIRAAARRFGFNRRQNLHPVESIDDPRLAIGAIGTAFIGLDDLPTAERRAELDVQLRKHLSLSGEEAEEIEVLGQWFVEQCNGAQQAMPRLAKKLKAIDSDGHEFDRMMAIIQGLAASGAGLSTRQSEALQDIKTAFRLQ